MSGLIGVEILGKSFSVETADGLFSPGGLDEGTRAMLALAEFSAGMKVLDLGCGWGAVGLIAARLCGAENVWMSDIKSNAVRLAQANVLTNGLQGVHIVQSDGFRSIGEAGFDLILSNPPYHTDFTVAKHFIEKGFNRLAIGGRLMMVTKRRDWYKNKLASTFGGVRVAEDAGYFIFTAERRSREYAKRKK